MHGQFTWYELTTPDVDAAKKFYPTFTGWGTQSFDKDYTMWTTGGAPFAGIFKLSPEMKAQGVPPNWMPYVESSNVDETARLATSLGGKTVVGPQDIPGTGRFAVLQDPQGATFGIYKSSGPSQGWDGTPVIGRFAWHELMTTDYQKAYDFYQRLFGWEKTGEMDMGGGSMYRMFGKGKPYGGMYNRMAEMANMPPFWLLYIDVKDVKNAVAAATKTGAKLYRGPMEIPGGQIAILGDPQGAGFAVYAETKPAAKTASKSTKRPKAKKAAAKRSAAKKSAAKKSGAKKAARKAAKKGGAKKTARKRSAAKKSGRKAAKSKRRR